VLRETTEGVPVIDGALTTLVCAHDRCNMVGDHLLLIGRVVRTESHPGEPLVFHAGQFVMLPSSRSAARDDVAQAPV
jgi:flavin reductase (DIM6/NTAB) family NADH-FMN oxidoreductase RutF